MSNSNPICSYGPACYRRNVDHFRKMAHPYLEDLLDRIPDGPIASTDLPEKLNFACTNRLMLKEQLEALREARRTKSDGGESSRANVEGKDDRKDKNCKSMRAQALSMLKDCGEAPDYVAEQGKFAEKHRNAAPYYIFFNAVQKAKATWNQRLSVTMPELLDKSLGKITLSLHLNFVVNLGWLCAQYMIAEQKTDMMVFYGEREDESPLPAHIKMHKVKCPGAFGCHHSKLSILKYEDGGIRVIVSTANLYKDDWHLRTQGLWMSEHLPRLPTSADAKDGESKTGFKKELLLYLSQYSNDMDQWRAIVKRTDFSSVDVALVFSVPGTYRVDSEQNQWGHRKLSTLLKKHVEIPQDEPSSTIIAQCSSMGSFGADYKSWIGSQLVNSMVKTTRSDAAVTFKLIFPTIENYKRSYDMQEAANCLCYTEAGHRKQKWLQRHLHQWKADRTGRSSAIPHIKTFTRISSDKSKIWWFVLGSANLSKAAWGYWQGRSLTILNYEASVVFLPKFVTGTSSFPAKQDPEITTPTFPIPYDRPLTPYGQMDKPFVSEFFQKGDRVFSDPLDN